MAKDLRKQFGIALGATVALGAFGYFLWGEVQLQNQMEELDRFCNELRLQSSLADVENATTFAPHLHMILLDPSAEGEQMGSIYFVGSGRSACSITFMRGRLTRKSFGSGNLARDPSAPHEKLKSW